MAIFTAIGAAIGAIGSFIGGLGAVGSFLLKTAVGIGLNLLAQAIAGKPKDPTFSISGTLQVGGDIPRSFIMGRTATAGSLVWVNTWGKDGDTPNANLTQVIAISDLPINGVDDLWVNGEKVTIGTTPHSDGRGYPVQEYRKDGRDNLWVKFHDGTQTAADSFLTGRASTGQRQWNSDRIGRGVAYAVLTAKSKNNMFSGVPSFKFVVSGQKLYDPSRDDTVGGVGDHRWGDPATWGGDGDHNPAVQIYNLLRGVTYNGQWFYGLQGVTAARLPAANWIAQIEKCRAGDIYRAGGEIPVEAPLAPAIEALLTACQGRLSEVGGVYSIYVGEPDLPIVSFTDGDILSTEEQSFTPFFGLADTINGIAATYPSPEDGWAEKAAPPIYRTDLEALAGNRRLMADVSLDFVPYPEQVQRLMKSALEEGQRARRHTMVFGPEFWPYAVPGAIWSATSERNGYVGKWFRVDGAVDRANLDVMVDLTEVDPDDFDWNPDTDYRPPVDGAVGPIVPPPQPIIDWAAFADSVKDHDGVNRRPAIRISWDNTEGRLDDVVGVEFEVRLATSHETVYTSRTDQPEAGALLISQGLLPLTQYEVRGRFIPGGDRETLWSGWLFVLTLDIRITDIEAKFGSLSVGVKQTLQDLFARHAFMTASLQQLALNASEAAGTIAKESHVAVRYRNATASAIQALRASVEEVDGQILAIAESITTLNATVGDTGAGALWRMTVEAGEGEVVSRIVLQVRATVADEWVHASTVWEAGFDAEDNAFGRIVLSAAQTMIADEMGNVLALFDADGVHLSNAFIANLTGDHIQFDTLTGDHIKVGSIDSPSLALNAVTEFSDLDFHQLYKTGSRSYDDGSWTLAKTLVIDIPPGKAFIEFLNIRSRAQRTGGSGNMVIIDIFTRIVRDSDIVLQHRLQSTNSGATASATNFSANFDGTATTYQIHKWYTMASQPDVNWEFEVTVESGILWWKR